jgi:hypothetical protein
LACLTTQIIIIVIVIIIIIITMGTNVLLPLAVNSKSEQKVDSLPLLGLKPMTFGTQGHLSDRSAKSHRHFTVCDRVVLNLPGQAVASLETLSIKKFLGYRHLLCLGLAAWRCTTNHQGACVMRLKRLHG